MPSRAEAVEYWYRPKVSDLPGWRLIFTDDFTQDVPLGQFPGAVSQRWGAYPTTYKDTSKHGTYDPAGTISIANSVMTIHLFSTPDGIVHVAAPVPYIRPPTRSAKWPGQIYGRYATRARFPDALPGFKVAWMLWPDKGTNTTGSPSGTGGNGEIDWPEHNLSQMTATSAFLHPQDATVNDDQYQCSTDRDLQNWHTYVVEWSPNLCRFLCDGEEIGRITERVPYTSMHWVIQCETALSGGKPAADVEGDIELDWVGVWAKA